MAVLVLLLGICGNVSFGTQTTQPATTGPADVKIERGMISLDSFKAIDIPDDDPKTAELLKPYIVKPEAFEYKRWKVDDKPDYEVFKIVFPSAVKSPSPKNNTVWGEYYRSKVKGSGQAIVILHPLDGSLFFPRMVARRTAKHGVHSIMIYLPYYGPRFPADLRHYAAMFADLKYLIKNVQQGVIDARRAARYLAEQPEVNPKKIGISGMSLGALIGALTMGVDRDFNKACLFMGGGDLGDIFTANANMINMMFTIYLRGRPGNADNIRKTLEPIEPLRFAHRADRTQVIMLNSLNDRVIPPVASKKLAKALTHCETVWYDAGHVLKGDELEDAALRTERFFDENPSD